MSERDDATSAAASRRAGTTGRGGSGTPGGGPDHEPLQAGQAVGRFTILGPIGRGGMGHVYAAYDARLDRKVAIKIIQSVGSGPSHEDARLRLTREARALARLSHRNVVAIHEAGESDGRLFLAMEHLAGTSMRAWLDENGGHVGWQRAVDKLRDAGLGLAAAHGADVVHRDFKPSNVLIADDGRVVVVDFGVARLADPALLTPTNATLEADGPEPLEPDDRLTRSGRVVGTPAYMAPEQLDGEQIDGRADQFSFCVTLYEAIVGRRPFEGRHLLELREAMRRGETSTPLGEVNAPSWLRVVLGRGLAHAPEGRFASMDELLASLRAPGSGMRDRLRWIAPLAAGGAVAAALTVGGRATEPAPRCDEASQRASAVWSDEKQAALIDAFEASRLPMAAPATERVRTELDRWSVAWGRVGDDACRATQIEKRQSDDALHATTACLEGQLVAFERTVATLSEPDEVVVERADRIAASLPDPDRCRDAAALAREASLADGIDAATVASVDEDLAAARLSIEAARYDAALATAEAALATANDADWSSGRARATFQAAVAVDRLGRYEEARDGFLEALALARAAGDARTAATALIQLVHESGAQLSRYDEATRWATVALASSEATGEELLVARAAHVRGVLADRRSRPEQALADHGRALEIRERLLGPDHLDTVESLAAHASALDVAGRSTEAIEALELAVERSTRAVGEAHPDTIAVMNTLGTALLRRGDSARGLALYERLVDQGASTWGPEHPNTASLLYGLAEAQIATGHRIAGRQTHQRALAIRERVLGEDHYVTGASVVAMANTYLDPHELEASLPMWDRALRIARALEDPGEMPAVVELNLGMTYQGLDRMQEAEQHLLGARAFWVGLHGEDHMRVADADTAIGALEYDTGRFAEAVTRLERALGTMEAAYGPDAAAVAYPLLDLARARRESGDLQAARRDFERVVAIRTAEGTPTVESTVSQFELARTLWRLGEREEARAKIVAARDRLRDDAEAGARDRVDEMTQWLASRG